MKMTRAGAFTSVSSNYQVNLRSMKTATLVLFIACWVVYAVSAPMARFAPHPDSEIFWPRIYRMALLAAIFSFVLMLLVHIAIDAKG